MGVTVATAAVLGVALAGANTGYQIESANEAEDKADTIAQQNKAKEDALLKEQQDQKAQAQANAASAVVRNQQRDSMRLNQSQAQGRASTILTSPLGVPATASAPGKTILGA